MIKVDLDPRSGFCGGVIRAIGAAEKQLSVNGRLYSLGEIVHNEEELGRLESLGLKVLSHEDLAKVTPGDLLIRAHGEPPETYGRLSELGFRVIDCTCPVVLKLQEDIREAYSRVKPEGGAIVIFGKIGHPEVLGLVGQVSGDACVVEDLPGLEKFLDSPGFNSDAPVELFSQTTKSPDGYRKIADILGTRCRKLKIHDTICAQVASRHRILTEFAASHDAVVFVAGGSSSNGKVLSELCRKVNPRTCVISSISELRREWFRDCSSVGVCGATSTPKWLLEDVVREIETI